MCTASLEKLKTGYCLRFNRDEQLTRQAAQRPSFKNASDGEPLAILPTDAEKGGTWIAVNRFGWSFCLLNDYQYPASQAQQAQDAFHNHNHSRGELVLALLDVRSWAECKARLQRIGTGRYPGFKLVVIDCSGRARALHHGREGDQWLSDLSWPLVSSSYGQAALDARVSSFHSINKSSNYDLDAFHRSHLPGAGALSVCVHRPDVETVSMTSILVSDTQVEMHYQAGSPCKKGHIHSLVMGRKHLDQNGSAMALRHHKSTQVDDFMGSVL